MAKIRFLAAAALLLGTVAIILADKPARPAPCPAACSKCPLKMQKVYAVADLVLPVPGMTGPFPGMAPAKCCDEGGCCALLAAYCPLIDCCNPDCSKTREADLIKLITSSVHPECWSAHGGSCSIDYASANMSLVVAAPAETQEQVQALLEKLRKYQDVNISVEIRFLTVSQDFYERFGLDADFAECPHVTRVGDDGLERIGIDFECCDGERCSKPKDKTRAVPITQAQMRLLMESAQGDPNFNVLQAPKITTLNSQQATIDIRDFQKFVTGVTVEAVDGQTRVVPKNTTVTTGLSISLLPLLSADRRFVGLDFHADHTYPASPLTPMVQVTAQITPKFEGGFVGQSIPFTQCIQQPNFKTLTCDSHLVIPDGGTMLIDAGKLDRGVRCATEACVPVLSRIPYLNRLFRKVSYDPVTEHMLVMVTARVICPVHADECNPSDRCKSQGGCGATATCQTGGCKTRCCDKGCCTTGSCSNGCCKSGCCEKGCCQNGGCAKCGGKPAKVATFEEESSIAPAKPAQAAAQAVKKSPVELRAEKMAAKLVQKYHEACANGEPEKARRYGRQALDLDPECFGKTMFQESYQKMPQPPEVRMQELINQSDTGGQIRGEWQRPWIPERPSHLTPDRVHGGIQ